MNEKKSVLIVGAGPVGMVLAIQLARFGIKARIIEKRVDFTQGSKALSINSASLKIFDSMGLAEKLLSKGKKVKDVNVYWNGNPFFHLDCRRIANTPYKYYLTLPQPETEKILADHLKELNQSIERQVALTSLKNTDHGIDVELLHSDSSVEAATYDYVIGCDGHKSIVRTCLGKRFVGLDYDMHLWLFDAKLSWNNTKKDSAQYFVNEKGFAIAIPLTDELHRLVIKEDQPEIKERHIQRSKSEYQQLIDRFIHDRIKIEHITWQSNAPIYNRLVSGYRENNIFLAGDAAHLFSPIGGLGMNTGIQDAYNLAWKLAGVILHTFHPKILESYENERLTIATQLINGTDETTKLITRRDTDISGRLQNWMPLIKNREAMKTIWPQRFSGLEQKYSDQHLTADHCNWPVYFANAGNHIPFAVGEDMNNSPISSYHLTSDHSPVILIFEHRREPLNTFLRKISKFKLVTFVVSMSPLVLTQSNVINLLDNQCQYYRTFKAKEGDIVLVRPDGYIGCRSHIDKLAKFKKYLSEFLYSDQP